MLNGVPILPLTDSCHGCFRSPLHGVADPARSVILVELQISQQIKSALLVLQRVGFLNQALDVGPNAGRQHLPSDLNRAQSCVVIGYQA